MTGTLYGTTQEGGGSGCSSNGCGTVFALDPSTGGETVLHSFGSGTDGASPEAALIDVDGTLYGTTNAGGALGAGTVFALDLNTGAETVLYSFCSRQNCVDGSGPLARVIDVRAKLYGTTNSGGAHNKGVAFALDPKTGLEKVLYSFCAAKKCADGEAPDAGLLDVKGTLYGTTYAGGARKVGTVFALTR